MKTKAFSIYFIYTWLFLFSFIPLCMVFIVSFLSYDSVQLIALPFTLQNYQDLFSSLFANVFFRSAAIALCATFLCLLLAYPFSYFLIKSKYQSVLLLLIIIPFWSSSLVRTYAMISILKLHGVLNNFLLTLHLIDKPIAMLYSNLAVMWGLVYNLFPFMVLPIFTNMERFDFRLIEAAADLGANRLTIFYKVFLPHTLTGIVAGCIMVFLPAMTLFYIPNVLGGARSVLLGNMIQNQFLVTQNWPQGSATSMLLTFILVLLLLLFRRNRNKGAIL